jgi:uncharacterized protein (TIGR00369 family)
MMSASGSDGRGVARYVGVTMREIGDWETGEIVLEGNAPLRGHVAGSGGALGSGALLTMCDNVAGLCGGLASLPDGWVVTTNLMMRRTRLDVAGALTFRSTVLRSGRAATVTDVTVSDGGGPIAYATLRSAVMVPAAGVPNWSRPVVLNSVDESADGSDDFDDFNSWLGMRSTTDGMGVELDVFDEIRNPWGIVHGGVTASLIDAAAMSVVPGALALVDATVHYLAPGRVGPLRANAILLGCRAQDHVVRVEVIDVGSDRTTPIAVAVATVRTTLGAIPT